MSAIAAPDAWTFGPVTRTDIVRYQGASGDFNPIHHDDLVAQSVGYPTAFSAGMFQAGLMVAYASRIWGARQLRRITVRFREQVWPGDLLDFSGEMSSVEGGIATVSLECRRRGGGVALSATARFVIGSVAGVEQEAQ